MISVVWGGLWGLFVCLGFFMEFYYFGEVRFGKVITLNQALCGRLINKLNFIEKPNRSKLDCREGLFKIYNYDINKDGNMTVKGFKLVQKSS